MNHVKILGLIAVSAGVCGISALASAANTVPIDNLNLVEETSTPPSLDSVRYTYRPAVGYYRPASGYRPAAGYYRPATGGYRPAVGGYRPATGYYRPHALGQAWARSVMGTELGAAITECRVPVAERGVEHHGRLR